MQAPLLTRMARLLTRMARMARMLTRMTRWLAYYTHSQSTLSQLRCKLNVMQTSCNSEKRHENGGLSCCDFVTLCQKGQGR